METSQLSENKQIIMKTFDDSNWRQEYKSYTSNRMELDLLEQGPKSLSQSWHLQALYSNWKKVKGIKDPEPLDLTTNFKDWSEKHDQTKRSLG